MSHDLIPKTTNYDDGESLPVGVVQTPDGFSIGDVVVRFYVEPVHGAGGPGPFPFPEGPSRKTLLLKRLWASGRRAILDGLIDFDRRFIVPFRMETANPVPMEQFSEAFRVLQPGRIVVYEQALVRPLEELGFNVRLEPKPDDWRDCE